MIGEITTGSTSSATNTCRPGMRSRNRKASSRPRISSTGRAIARKMKVCSSACQKRAVLEQARVVHQPAEGGVLLHHVDVLEADHEPSRRSGTGRSAGCTTTAGAISQILELAVAPAGDEAPAARRAARRRLALITDARLGDEAVGASDRPRLRQARTPLLLVDADALGDRVPLRRRPRRGSPCGSSPAQSLETPWRSASSYLSVWMSDRSSRPLTAPALSAARYCGASGQRHLYSSEAKWPSRNGSRSA